MQPGVYRRALEQRALLCSKIQIWCVSALDWAMNIEALPKIATQPT
jgi:hypothetical protein